MLQDILSIGDKIHIRLLDHTGKPITKIRPFVSQLVDYGESDVFHISAPIINSRIFLLESGRKYSLCFFTNKGLYHGICEVNEKNKDNNVIIFKVRLSSDLEKIQRRQYYRLEMVHDIQYRIITEEEEQLNQKLFQSASVNSVEVENYQKRLKELDSVWEKASVNDLSGGGTRFNSKNAHQPGDRMRIRLNFITDGKLKKMTIEGEIIAANKLIHLPGIYEYRVEFKKIHKRDREDLIKFIFEQERRRRKNEKG
ncbi:MAG: hypothetical protein E7255_01655 [Lachnospiraceae bacterium]|jgi:c-di-GMP-binding flagellar brake protein YcgR|nr:hypothetical protein [Lachnospiraceae bacterium]